MNNHRFNFLYDGFCNTYLYGKDEVLIIDPSVKARDIIFLLKKDYPECKNVHILLTHGHYDHFCGIYDLINALNGYHFDIYIHKNDSYKLTNSVSSCSIYFGKLKLPPFPKYEILHGEEELVFGDLKVKVIPTPGHTNGSVSYYVDDVLFSGDTLFYLSVGRTDLPTSSQFQMIESLKRLMKLPQDTKVYPGHDESTTIKCESKNNPYYIRSI